MERKAVCASDIPEPDRSYFIPWSLEMIYAVEPSLETIRRCAFDQVLQWRRKRGVSKSMAVRNAYITARNSAERLIGWYARDPRLRSRSAYEFYIYGLCDALEKEFLK